MLLCMTGATAFAHDIEVKNNDGVTSNYVWTNENEVPQCATPTIDYSNWKLTFNCATQGAEIVKTVTCSDNQEGSGSTVSLTPTYTITAYAKAEGYRNSEVATATISWRNGRPVFIQGFNNVNLEEVEAVGDINADGKVNIGDITALLNIIAMKDDYNQDEVISTPTQNEEAKGDGTVNNPYNVSGVLQFILSLGSDVVSQYPVYIKGKISQISEEFSTQYGNASFYISDDGSENHKFYAYRILYLGNKKFSNGDEQIKVGDEVIICGNVINFKGNTPETAQGMAYLYSLNGKTEPDGDTPEPTPDPIPNDDAKGDGTEANPFNSVAAIAYASTFTSGQESERDVYIAGKVVSIREQYSTQYGNASFYISDDGTANNQFYVFRALYLNNEKYTSGDLIKVGDDVVVCGKVTNYNGNTPETVQGKSYLVSLNSYSGGNQGDDNGGENQGNDNGGENQGVDVVNGNNITMEFAAQGYSNAQDISTITLSDGTTLTFNAGTNKNSPRYYTSGSAIRIYPGNYFVVNSNKEIASIVLNCSDNNAEGNIAAAPGTVTVNGMEITISGINNTTTQVTNTHTETGATTQLRISSIAITYVD